MLRHEITPVPGARGLAAVASDPSVVEEHHPHVDPFFSRRDDGPAESVEVALLEAGDVEPGRPSSSSRHGRIMKEGREHGQ